MDKLKNASRRINFRIVAPAQHLEACAILGDELGDGGLATSRPQRDNSDHQRQYYEANESRNDTEIQRVLRNKPLRYGAPGSLQPVCDPIDHRRRLRWLLVVLAFQVLDLQRRHPIAFGPLPQPHAGAFPVVKGDDAGGLAAVTRLSAVEGYAAAFALPCSKAGSTP